MPPHNFHKLSDSPFYKLKPKKRMAEILFTSEKSIKETLSETDLYVRKWKHKKEEKWLDKQPTENAEEYRPIDIPHPRLKEIQSRIAYLLSLIEPPDYLFSPVKGRSYVDNAKFHINSKAFWMLDIENFFPSCTSNNVAWFFKTVMKCSPDVTAILVRLTTLNGSLPQGSPCSPILAFFSNKNMFDEIHGIAEKSNNRLSVYADDITISGDIIKKETVWKIKQRVRKQGLNLKDKKEHSLIFKPAEITGVIVRDYKSLLPNRKHKALSELRQEYVQTRNPKERQSLENKIRGRLSQKRQVEG